MGLRGQISPFLINLRANFETGREMHWTLTHVHFLMLTPSQRPSRLPNGDTQMNE